MLMWPWGSYGGPGGRAGLDHAADAPGSPDLAPQRLRTSAPTPPHPTWMRPGRPWL